MRSLKNKKKLYVLDTNVLAHDWQCVFKFEEHDIAVPFTVIQELDHLKSKDGSVSYNARQALKFFDQYDGNIIDKNLIADGLGSLFVVMISDDKYLKKYKSTNTITNNDDEIIMHVHYLNMLYKKEYSEIVLVSKDAGIRVKASSLKHKASDYLYDSVQVDQLYKGKFELEIDWTTIRQLKNKQKGFIEAKNIDFLSSEKYNYNSCFILKAKNNAKYSSLACFQKDKRDRLISDTLVPIQKRQKSGSIKIETVNAEQSMGYHLLMNRDISLVTINGIAGTGKTLLALLSAIEQVVISSVYKKIIAMRPLISLSDKDIGALPGTEKQKVSPYMRPVIDNLEFIKTRSVTEISNKISRAQEEGIIIIEAMAHVRGRTYNDTLIIIDEAQNLTPMEAKTLITRIGKNSKIVLIGDVFQIDSPYLNESSNGLAHVIDKFTKANYPYYGHITLEKGERSELSAIAAQLL